MNVNFDLARGRLWIRHMVWWTDCAAAAVGWSFLFLLALSGFSLLIAGFLIGDFFSHYVAATDEARGQFHLFAVPFVAGVFSLTVWMRWSTRALISTRKETHHVPTE